MTQNESASENNAPIAQLEFDFTAYENDTIESDFSAVEKAHIDAITKNETFTDLFEDAECMNRLYESSDAPAENAALPTFSSAIEEMQEEKSAYYLFRAHDAISGRNIFIKATNPAYEEDETHEKSLEWEAKLLEHLKNKSRFQNLTTPLKKVKVSLVADGENYIVPVSFFATGFLKLDIKKSFFDTANDRLAAAANRLTLFASIITAVQALHREGIAHRDLKPSNFMGTIENGKSQAVAIDLGSALAKKEIEEQLRLYSPLPDLTRRYAAPELYSGFSKNIALAQSADIYSLGCMLFEILDKRTYYTALLSANGRAYWEAVNYLMVDKDDFGGNEEKRLEQFHKNLDVYSSPLAVPRLSENSILPPYIRVELQALINRMCDFDYRKRPAENELDGIKKKLRVYANILNDAHLRALYKKRKEMRKARREGR